MAFFAQLGADPYRNQAGQLGQAMGEGLGVRFRQGEMQNQQGQIAKALFGDNANEFSSLPVDKQIKYASFLQKNNEQSRKNQLQTDKNNLINKILGNNLQSETDQGEFDNSDNDMMSDNQIAMLSTVDPNLAKILQSQKDVKLRENRENKKIEQKNQDKIGPYKSALKTIDNMKALIKKGNLGLMSGVRGVYSPKTRSDKALYAQLGKSLISFATTIPIRNKLEFETLSSDLYNPNNTDATNNGILEAMENIITQSLNESQNNKQQNNQPSNNKQQNNQPSKKKQSLEDIW